MPTDPRYTGASSFHPGLGDGPPPTPPESLFRRFVVHCGKCGSYQVRPRGDFDEDAGEMILRLQCLRCHNMEEVKG